MLSGSGQHTADVRRDLFILAVSKEHLGKIGLADGLLQEVLVDLLQNREHVLVGDLLDLGQDAAVSLFRGRPGFGIAAAHGGAQQLFKDIFQIQLRAPAEVHRKGDGEGVAGVDLREQIALQRFMGPAAHDAGEGVQREHGAHAGAAARDDEVGRAGIEQDRSQQAFLDRCSSSHLRRFCDTGPVGNLQL